MEKQISFNIINAMIGMLIMIHTDLIIAYVIALIAVIVSGLNIITINRKIKKEMK